MANKEHWEHGYLSLKLGNPKPHDFERHIISIHFLKSAMNWDIQYPIFRHTNTEVDQHFSINAMVQFWGYLMNMGMVITHQR